MPDLVDTAQKHRLLSSTLKAGFFQGLTHKQFSYFLTISSRFNPDKAREMRIPEGPAWGKLHKGESITLDDGRVVRASPGHPLADGRPLAAIGVGDRLDGATVVSATPEAYDGGSTFDLLPDGPTGVYLADGIPLGSTLSGG